MELVLLAVFSRDARPGGVASVAGRWMVLWLIVLVGTLVPLVIDLRRRRGGDFYPVLASLLGTCSGPSR